MAISSMAVQGAAHWMRAFLVLLLCLSEARPAAAPETSRNFYDTLNVEPTATGGQIKKAFRKLAIKYHPDKNKSGDAEKTFREIAEAYSVLSDREKRKLYDSVGHDAFVKNEGSVDPEEEDDEDGTSFHFSFSDFFHELEEGLFAEEPHFHWSFSPDGEEEDAVYEHYSFEGPGFSLYFRDEDENEDVYYY